MDKLLKDLFYGFRMLVKRPGFTVVAIITLALGIGASAAIFSVVNAVVLNPLPYRDADQIMTLWQTNTRAGISKQDASPANALDWRDQSQAFEQIAIIEPWSFEYVEKGEPEKFRASLVTEGFFDIMGTRALYGRTLTAEDYEAGKEKSIILSYGVWKRWFGSDQSVIGQPINFEEETAVIVGVMPPEFQFPDKTREMWAPLVLERRHKTDRGGTYMKVTGRLKPGVSVEQAQSEMDAIAAGLASQYPQFNEGIGIRMIPLPEQMVGEIRPALVLLLGAVGFVLLIACANVANLLFARGFEREHELAIRTALGAGRSRLVRQLLTESLTLGILGGALGLLLSYWLLDIILAFAPATLPRIEEVSIDGRVLAFTFSVSIITALIFGLLPALQFSKPDLQGSLKEGGRGATAGSAKNRIRNLMVVSEIALALVLLVGAGLLMRSFVNLLNVDPGFVKENVMALQVFVYSEKYRTPQQRAAFFNETIDRIENVPGVKSVGTASMVPFLGEDSIEIDTTFVVEGRPAPEKGQEPTVYVNVAGGDYFSTMGIPLLRGRSFARTDDDKAPHVAVINETLARRYFPDEDPIGKKINVRFGRPLTREIVGVVGDVRHAGLDDALRPEVFLYHPQYPFGSMTYLVRTSADPAALMASVKSQVWQVNPNQTFYNISTMEQLVQGTVADRRFSLFLIGIFAVLALVLAAVGIYGVMSFTTSQRTHEIGVRLALGAQPSDVLGLIVQQGMKMTLAGIGLGVIASIAVTRVLSSYLFEVSTTDPVTFAGISILLGVVSLIACYIPARRATRVDPLVALRYE
jgi:putative ABC transport system permease protein